MKEEIKEEVKKEIKEENEINGEKKNEEKSKAIKFLECIENFFLNILDKIKLKFLADIYRNHLEGMRYLVFGALATIVNIASYSVFLYTCHIENAVSNILAWIVAAIFAYLTNRFFVFDSKVNDKKGILKEIVSFFGCRLLTLGVDEVIMIYTVDKLKFNAVLMKVIANIIVIILNCIFSKILIFKKNDKKED